MAKFLVSIAVSSAYVKYQRSSVCHGNSFPPLMTSFHEVINVENSLFSFIFSRISGVNLKSIALKFLESETNIYLRLDLKRKSEKAE